MLRLAMVLRMPKMELALWTAMLADRGVVGHIVMRSQRRGPDRQFIRQELVVDQGWLLIAPLMLVAGAFACGHGGRGAAFITCTPCSPRRVAMC